MKYDLSVNKLLKKTSLYGGGWAVDGASKNRKGYFCSELVAAAYKSLGLIDTRISCSQYWPGLIFN